MINFCFDNIIDITSKKYYPNLVQDTHSNYEDVCGNYSDVWPYSDPPRLLEYLDQEKIQYSIFNTKDAPTNSFYIINISFFDHNINWFKLLPQTTLHRLQKNEIRLLYYYCEGDGPHLIRKKLYNDAEVCNVDKKQIHFIMHNTVAKNLSNFYYFNDDEILYKNAQHYSGNLSLWHNKPRTKKFTCLVRTHKDWRFVVFKDLLFHGILQNSYASYNCVNYPIDEQTLFNQLIDKSNPLVLPIKQCSNQIDDKKLSDKKMCYKFHKMLPLKSDNIDTETINNYETHVGKYFEDSYWNIILETHLDIDSTNGVFITEKTWKPILHQQPFIIFGTVGSLQHLRDLGYRTFDNVIDESYDLIKDNRLRYQMALDEIIKLNSLTNSQLQDINTKVKDIVLHNSNVFLQSKKHRLITLINDLLADAVH